MSEITRVLQAIEAGDAQAAEELLPLVYRELRGLAAAKLRREKPGQTLQATALVHEAWLRLVGDEGMSWRDRGHFYSAASEAMRRVLVDHARRVGSEKRGGAAQRIALGAVESEVEIGAEDFAPVEEALVTLAREDERAAAVASLRFLSGLSVEETARALGASARTIHREWSFARARLRQLLGDAFPVGGEEPAGS